MNKYEKLIEYIINEDEERASQLFHQIVVEKSREIYESLNEVDYDQSTDLENDVEYSDQEEEGFDDEGEMSDEETMDFDTTETGEDDYAETSDDEYSEYEEDELADKVEDLESKFDELMSEFESLMADSDEGEEETEEEDEYEGEEETEEDDEMQKESIGEATLNLKPVQKPNNPSEKSTSPVATGKKSIEGNVDVPDFDNSQEKGRKAPSAKSLNGTTFAQDLKPVAKPSNPKVAAKSPINKGK